MTKTSSIIALFVSAPLYLFANITASHAAEPMSGTVQSEAEMAKILLVANDAEIDAAKLAKKKTDNPAIKTFSEHMISAHKENNKNAKDVAKDANIKPVKNEMAKSLEDDADMKLAELKKLKGPSFDSAYLNQQIAMHETLLKTIDEKFIPAAKSPEWKSFLEKTRVHVSSHIDEAKLILSKRP